MQNMIDITFDPTQSSSEFLFLQAKHDRFVPFKEAKALHDSTLYLTRGSLDDTCEEHACGTDGRGAVIQDVISTEVVKLPGGHFTGFLKAPYIMPDAVMTAIERLRAKQSMLVCG